MNKQKKASKGLVALVIILIVLFLMVWGFIVMLFVTSDKNNDDLEAIATEEIAEMEEMKNAMSQEDHDKVMDEEFKEKVTLAEEAYNNQDFNDAIKNINEALKIKDDEIAFELKKKYTEEQIREKEEVDRDIEVEKETLLKNISKEYDDMQDLSWYNPKGELNYSAENGTAKSIFYCYLGERNSSYWMELRTGFAREGWIFVEKIIVKADSDRFTIDFDILKDRKGDVISGGIKEWIDVKVDSALLNNLKKVIDSEEAKVRYQGDTHHTEYTINSTQKKQLKDIIDYYELVK